MKKPLRSKGLALTVAVLALLGTPRAQATEECPAASTLRRDALGYWTWSLGASPRQQVGRNYFVAIPDGVPNDGDGAVGNPVIYTGSASFTVSGGTTLVLPLSMWVGEGYTRASMTPDDDPSQPPRAFFTGQVLTLALDGRVAIDSARHGLACQYVDSAFFEEPIQYHPAQYRYTDDRGIDVYASSALWVKGLVTTIKPLTSGRHTIHLRVDTLGGWGYDNTWSVTVTR